MFELDLLLKRARKLWDNQTVIRSIITNEALFPLYLDLPAVSSRNITDNFVQIRSEVQLFIDGCKLHNIDIIFKEINHRQFGVQRLPKQVCFTTFEDYLRFVGKEREYKLFSQSYDYIINHQPRLRTWLAKHTGNILEYQKKWPGLLKVCDYFLENPKPNKYIRELAISGVDSKFIEQHKSILTMLLNELLLPEWIIETSVANRRHEFEVRFGLKYIEPVIRFRILDKLICIGDGNNEWFTRITDYTVTRSEFVRLNIPCSRIFITENKINGLSFPDVDGAIIIFGLGYGIETLKDIAWFTNKDIIYWGDIDTHGFAMLSQLRSYYPQVRSILMNLPTLNSCRDMWVSEPVHTRCTAKLPYLSTAEQETYQILLSNKLGEHIRLEQERISYLCVNKILTSLT
jgi:hypothetical protein